MNSLDKAKEIAEKVHGTQSDKKDYPYMAHIMDVVTRVSDLGTPYQIVAMLHDAIEDAQPQSFRKSISSQIQEHFDENIFEAILAITKNSNEDYFLEYLPRVKNNKLATKVKIADSSHNLSKAHLIDNADQQKQLREKYIKVLNFLGVIGAECENPIIFNGNKWVLK